MKFSLKDSPQRKQNQAINNGKAASYYDEMLRYFLLSILMISLMLSEWTRWYYNTPPSPILYSLIAFVTVTCSVFKFFQVRSQLRPFKQEKDQETVVDKYMQRLRNQGAKIYSGIPSEGFVLDRVVFNKNGIFVIEIQIHNKTANGTDKILFNGESVLINGTIKTSNPIIQVKAEANWLIEILFKLTGQKFDVKPIVVFPDCVIETTKEATSSGIWVLNAKTLPKFIKNNQEQLKPKEVELITLHFTRYIRNNRE